MEGVHSVFSCFHIKTGHFFRRYVTVEHKFCLDETQINGFTIRVNWTNHGAQKVRLDDLIAPNTHANFFYS